MHAFLEANVDGVHDLGGMHGFGPVVREADEPTFHATWEPVVVAIARSGLAYRVFNIDEFRHAIERMAPDHYLSATYYERWLDAVTRLAIEKGVTTPEELERRAGQSTPDRGNPTSPTEEINASTSADILSPASSFRPATALPRFSVGDAVRTVPTRSRGHTRLPRYARRKRGLVHAYRGFHVFPDTSAHGRGENPQPLYSVRFEGAELWGPGADPSEAVYLDLWETYLTAVSG